MRYLKWFWLIGARNFDWILTAFFGLLWLLTMFSSAGCATLKAQAADMRVSQATALLDDFASFAHDEVACDPSIVAQIGAAFVNRDLSQLWQPVACIIVAAREVAAQVRTGLMPPPPIENIQVVHSLTSIRVQLAARTKQ